MILSFTRRFSDTGASSETDGRQSGRQDAVREYDIVTDGTESEVSVEYNAPLPRRGNPHPDDPYRRVRNVEINQISPIMFRARVTYVKEDTGEDNEEPQNPVLQPSKIRYGHQTTEEQIDETIDGKPICTVLGEQFDPPISRPFSDRVITIERNVATFNAQDYDDYFEVVNTDTFLNYPAGRLLLDFIDAESITEGDFTYFRLTAQMRARKQGRATSVAKTWWRRIRAEGLYVNAAGDDAFPPLIEHFKIKGESVSKPVLHTIDTGHYVDDPNDAEWYEFETYEGKSFQALNLI